MPDLTDEEHREAAIAILREHASDVERMSIREHLDEEYDREFGAADVDAIFDLIETATITIGWPTAEGAAR